MRTRHPLRIAALAVVAALTAACGSDDSSGGGGGGNGAAGDPGEPQSGGTLSIVQQSEPRTLDPGVMSNNTSLNAVVGNSLYGQLLTVDDDGEIAYGLAESLTSSDGGTTWQLQLRDGLEFSDGTPLDAAAVQANWERLTDPALGSSAITTAVLIASMTPSGQTLDFTLVRPMVGFADGIARTLNWIAAPQALEAGAQAFDENPIGAGPFVLESWTRSGEMVLVRNDNFYDAPRPYLDELVLTVNSDDNQRLSTMTSGGADAITVSSPDLVAMAAEAGAETTVQRLSGGLALSMNSRQAPFDDVRARLAVAQAVDLEMVNSAVYAGNGEVPRTLFAPDSPHNGDATLPEHDAEAAQELFDELAAEGSPVEFSIVAFATTQSRRLAEAVQAQLNQFDNVSVEVEVLDFPAALMRQRTFDFQMINGGVNFAENSPAMLLDSYLSSTSRTNASGIADPELDEALETALVSEDADERSAAYQVVAERFAALMPNLPYIIQPLGLAHGDHVHGVEMYGNGGIRTDTLWVSE